MIREFLIAWQQAMACLNSLMFRSRRDVISLMFVISHHSDLPRRDDYDNHASPASFPSHLTLCF